MKHLFLKIFFLVLLFGGADIFFATGASLEYATFISTDSATNSFVMKYGGLEEKKYYDCSLSSLACTATSSRESALSASPGNIFDSIKNTEERVIFKWFSLDRRFVYYYQFADEEHPYRFYNLIDTKTKKSYYYKSPVPFLDLMTEQNRLFSISPDSKTLYYLDDRDGSPAIYYVDLTHLSKSAMKGKRVTKTTYSVADFIAYDENNVYFIANRVNPLTWSLYHYNIETSGIEKIADNVSYADPIKKIGERIVFLRMRGNSVVPSVYNPASKTFSDFLLPFASAKEELFGAKVARYGSLWGSLSLPDISTAPKGKALPLVVWLHGGPYRQSSLTLHSFSSYGVYDWVLNEARKNGTAILKLDYNGSYGYGTDFIESLKGGVGVKDVKEVLSALRIAKKELEKEHPVSHVYLVGNSYGGYLALRTIAEDPEAITGAFSINGVTDWSALLTNLEDSLFNAYFDGPPGKENKKMYDNADILGRYDDIDSKNKITLVQSTDDMTIDPLQATLLKSRWQPFGINVTVIPIQGEDHVFHKTASISTLCNSLFAFISIGTGAGEKCAFQ